jgi:hypothetical protein
MGKEALEKVKAILKARDKAASSSVIQVWQSDLYDFRNSRITLVTIAFLQMNDENSTYPEDAPKEFRDDRVGWCWASQKFIAERAGKSESQAHRDIKQFVEDGVVKTRSWTDSNKTEHLEYHVDEDVVAAHQRVKDAPRPARSRRDYKDYDNKGAFTSSNQPRNERGTNRARSQHEANNSTVSDESLELKERSHSTQSSEYPPATHALPPSSSRVEGPATHASSPPAADASANASTAVVGGCSRGFGSSSSSQADAHLVPASRGLGPAAPYVEYETPKPGRGLRARQTRPEGKVTKAERKPLPNRLCYPELYAQWQKRRGKIPSCKRCKEILFWEEHHDCPGFREHEYGPILGPVAPKGAEVFDGPPRRKYLTTFDDFDGPEEDDLSGYEDFDDDHPARAVTEEL